MIFVAATLRDIARDLGVSVVTVSKILRNHPDISEETRERVLKRVKELDYQPNMAARALVTGRSLTIGLVVPDLVHPFFSQVAKALSSVLRMNGYSLLISSSEDNPELEREEIERILARGVDALIVASTQLTPESFRLMERRKRPFVLIDRHFRGLKANFVGTDDERLGDMATEHLISVGCRRIAHMRGPNISTALGRLAGYTRALARNGLEVSDSYVQTISTSDDAGDIGGYGAMQRLLRLSPRPDAVFCFNDPTAIGSLKAVLESGLRVPEDIAILGCGNVRHLELLRVPLSSIDQDSAGMGRKAADLALSLVKQKKGTSPLAQTVLLSPTIVARESTHRQSDHK
jgi:LacI family transcriptional regulator